METQKYGYRNVDSPLKPCLYSSVFDGKWHDLTSNQAGRLHVPCLGGGEGGRGREMKMEDGGGEWVQPELAL